MQSKKLPAYDRYTITNGIKPEKLKWKINPFDKISSVTVLMMRIQKYICMTLWSFEHRFDKTNCILSRLYWPAEILYMRFKWRTLSVMIILNQIKEFRVVCWVLQSQSSLASLITAYSVFMSDFFTQFEKWRFISFTDHTDFTELMQHGFTIHFFSGTKNTVT